jgi:hypothetical protein
MNRKSLLVVLFIGRVLIAVGGSISKGDSHEAEAAGGVVEGPSGDESSDTKEEPARTASDMVSASNLSSDGNIRLIL